MQSQELVRALNYLSLCVGGLVVATILILGALVGFLVWHHRVVKDWDKRWIEHRMEGVGLQRQFQADATERKQDHAKLIARGVGSEAAILSQLATIEKTLELGFDGPRGLRPCELEATGGSKSSLPQR